MCSYFNSPGLPRPNWRAVASDKLVVLTQNGCAARLAHPATVPLCYQLSDVEM